MKYLDMKGLLLAEIDKKGGWVNAHAHIDRAYTLTAENLEQCHRLRSEKWILNSELRKNSTVAQIEERMTKAVETMLEQGVQALGSFIDVDKDVKDKAIKAADKVREKYKKDIKIKFLNQSSYGLFSEDAREWFEVGADFVDIIGGLLKADAGREAEHLDILLSAAKKRGKMVHCHVDELNIPEEHETELLAKKAIEHGMQGKVVGIHTISLNCRPKEEREAMYDLIEKAKLMIISCPMSWLNERRSESLAPIHNPITPLDELLPHNIPVGLGTDNIADIWMPWNDANMWNDLRVLIEASRTYDIDVLSDVATTNGLKILGIS